MSLILSQPPWMNLPTGIASHFVSATLSSITPELWRRRFYGTAKAMNCSSQPIILVTMGWAAFTAPIATFRR